MTHHTHNCKISTLRPRGFTLVETLVSVSILLLVIIGPMTIAWRGMQMGFYANEQTTAVFLAQEALESIQNLRNDNALSVLYGGQTDTWAWYTQIPSSCKNQSANSSGCDYVRGSQYVQCTPESSSNPCKLKVNLDGTTYVYGRDVPGGTDSIYTRTLKLGDPLTDTSGNIYAVPVTVTVSWPTRLFTNKTVSLQTWIYDIYEHYE